MHNSSYGPENPGYGNLKCNFELLAQIYISHKNSYGNLNHCQTWHYEDWTRQYASNSVYVLFLICLLDGYQQASQPEGHDLLWHAAPSL